MPSELIVLMDRAKVPAYPYEIPNVPDFTSMGLQSVINFNGLNINDRLRPDRYLVKKITGLGQADIRDNRIVRPGDHGEIPYDSFFGGRTVTFEGAIEAGSLDESARMYADLDAALGSLVEYPMKFRWWDVRDEFSEASTSRAFWSVLNGAALNFLGDGTMRFTKSGLAYYSLRKYVDARVVARIVIGLPSATASWGVALPVIDNENYVSLSAVSTSGSFNITLARCINGVPENMVTPVSIPSQIVGQSLWLVLQKTGDLFAGNVYSLDPFANPGAPVVASLSRTLTGDFSDKFGDEKNGVAAIIASGNIVNWLAEDFRVESIWPGDFYINVKSVAPLAPQFTREGQTTSRFVTPFQFAVRQSNPAIRSMPTLQASMGPAIQQLQGRIYNRIFDQQYTVPIGPFGEIVGPKSIQQSVCINKGRWIARPIITINGGIVDPVVTSLTTGQSIFINGTIAENDFLEIDCEKHKIKNSVGAEQFGTFGPESKWIYLVNGPNVLIMTGKESTGNPSCSIVWQHTS